MRLWMGLMLLVALPLRAEEQTEQEKLAWLNYHLAVAEAPGDVRSDLRMRRMLDLSASLVAPPDKAAPPVSEPMRAYLARAQVVAAELDARIDAQRDSDPFLLAGDLGCWPKRADMSVCDSRRAKLEAFVPDNAYFGLVLMTQAWNRGDAEAFVRVARLAAAAEEFDSLAANGFQSLVERYRQVQAPAMPSTDALTRSHPAEVMAMGIAMATVSPAYAQFTQPCREAQGELRDHCLAMARKIMSQSRTVLEVGIVLPLVEAIGTPADIAAAREHRRDIQWLQARAMPLFAASQSVVVAGMDEYLERFGSEGEFAAMRALLVAHGIAPRPPADWTDPSAAPAKPR